MGRISLGKPLRLFTFSFPVLWWTVRHEFVVLSLIGPLCKYYRFGKAGEAHVDKITGRMCIVPRNWDVRDENFSFTSCMILSLCSSKIKLTPSTRPPIEFVPTHKY